MEASQNIPLEAVFLIKLREWIPPPLNLHYRNPRWTMVIERKKKAIGNSSRKAGTQGEGDPFS
jgi:hypothetical protein